MKSFSLKIKSYYCIILKQVDNNNLVKPSDIRFTTKDKALYAFCMQAPTDNIRIISLGKNSKVTDQKVTSIRMLGSSEKIKWNQEDEALIITKPTKIPDWQVTGFKIEFQK